MQRNNNRLAIAIVVTIIFVGETIAEWPTPLRVSQFQLEFYNPFKAILDRFWTRSRV
jgi:hypothetical protein